MSGVRLLAFLAGLLWAGAAAAQSVGDDDARAPALLVADSVFITPDRKLIAEGNVEAFRGDTRLRARRITYDRATGSLTIDGPIRLDEGGTLTVLASAAELDAGLQNGLLTGARMVFDEQVQLASLQMTRIGGRYTQLYKTAVTSCYICENGRPPLWQIRARRVIHDQLEQQLYFEDAQLRVLDVPVFYLPRLRLPDPNLDRSTGFLVPSVRTTSQLGTGARVPYFFRLGDHADLTLAPYLSPKTRTLGFRYRQAFRRGRIKFDGAYTRDDLIPGDTRGYIFGDGRFDLPRRYKLSFALRTTTDNAYLLDYGLPDLDRLQSEIALTRTRRNRNFRASLNAFNSLRDGENESLLPTIVVDGRWERRYFPRAIGGELRVAFEASGYHRTSDIDVLGRDVNRSTAELSWRRNWILGRGLRAEWRAALAADAFRIHDDSTFNSGEIRTTPATAFTLRYPMTRRMPGGATQYLEPMLQVGWSSVIGGPVPNDESRFAEFDRGNLLALSRFPAKDRREDGLAVVYGVNWARFAPAGWQLAATLGQILRDAADPDFSDTSGLSGTTSDVLVAAQLKYDDRLSLTARTLLDGGFDMSKAELRGAWSGQRAQLSGTYLWLDADPAEKRVSAVSEVWFDGRYVVNPNWTASANIRYDLYDARATAAGLGFVYRNECVIFNLSVNRRYTSSTSVEPSTDFGFTITLAGFSVDGEKNKYRRSCNRS